MSVKETVFSPIFRFIQSVNILFSRIEYHFEKNLKQVQNKNGQYILELQSRQFVAGCIKEIYQKLSGNKPIRVSFPKTNLKGKAKIVHLVVRIGTIGGAAKLIFDIIRGLGYKYAMEVIIFSNLNLEIYPNLKLHHFTDPSKTVDYLRKLDPDIIHAHYYGDWGGFHKHFEAILNANLRAKIIICLLVPIHIYRSKKIDTYVFISNYIKNIQHKHQGKEKIIYFGVNTDEFNVLFKTKWHNAVGMVYRLFNDKIDESTIELFIKLARERPSTKIYIIGDGKNFHYYVERTRQEGVRENFIFTGTIDYSEVNSYYERFDIFVAPVHTESWGVVVPNAMSKNMPVVAYRRGVLPEILGNTNILVNTEREMINALKYLLDHPKYARKIAAKGRERIIKKFSQQKMIKDYDRLYQELLK